MTKVQITDALILKLEYEIQEFQEGDDACEIIEVLLNDTIYDKFTLGYLTAHLEVMGSSYEGKELMKMFYNLVKEIKNI